MEDFKPQRTSSSHHGAFNGCQYFFWGRYIGKLLEGPPNPRVHAGRFGHDVVEAYDNALIKTKQTSDYEIFEKLLEAAWHNDKVLSEELYEETRTKLLGFAERHVIDLDYIYGVELPIALNWECVQVDWGAADAWVRSKLDRVDVIGDLVRVTDYKLQPFIPSETVLRAGMQGQIYPWLFMKLNPNINRFEMVFDYITWGKQVVLTFTKDELNMLEERLRRYSVKVHKKIQQSKEPEDWPATPGSICFICSYECPLLKQDIKVVQSMEDAEKVGKQVIAMKAKAKELQDKVQAWSKEGGNIDIGSGVYGYGLSESISADVKQLIDFCDEEGLPVDSFIQKNGEKLKKLKVNDREQYDKLVDIAGTKPSTRFGFTVK